MALTEGILPAAPVCNRKVEQLRAAIALPGGSAAVSICQVHSDQEYEAGFHKL
jgi:hypothetical protein